MLEKRAQTKVSIHEIIAKRWSPCAFDSHKNIKREELTALLEAARWAPSCYGDQPWRYILCDKKNNLTAWVKLLSCLADANQVWAKNAPLLILVTCINNFSHNGRANRWANYDTGASVENLKLQAVSMGLVAHSMGGFDTTRVGEVFNIPPDFTAMTVVAVGYQAEPSVLDEQMKERELKERERLPLNKLFFEGDWKNPFSG
jgi:nitroreductase